MLFNILLLITKVCTNTSTSHDFVNTVITLKDTICPLHFQESRPILLTWSGMELEGVDVNWSQAPGMRPPILGSSGSFVKNWSSCSLKSSTEDFVKFLSLAGRQLKSFGPPT